jgi:hypothetical protein
MVSKSKMANAKGGHMNERNRGHWNFAVGLGGLILVVVYIVTRLINYNNAFFLVIYGLLCGSLVFLGALLGWREHKFKSKNNV